MDVWHLLLLAALVSAALFMHILSCVLYNNWWPMLLGMRSYSIRAYNVYYLIDLLSWMECWPKLCYNFSS